jgi:hypothetical protein
MLSNNNEKLNVPAIVSIKNKNVLYQYIDIKFESKNESGSTTRKLVGYLVPPIHKHS